MNFSEEKLILKDLFRDIWCHSKSIDQTPNSSTPDDRWNDYTETTTGRDALKYVLPSIFYILKSDTITSLKKLTLMNVLNQFEASNNIRELLYSGFGDLKREELMTSTMEMEQSGAIENYDNLLKHVVRDLIDISKKAKATVNTMIDDISFSNYTSTTLSSNVLLDNLLYMVPITVYQLPCQLNLNDVVISLLHETYGLELILSLVMNGGTLNLFEIVRAIVNYSTRITYTKASFGESRKEMWKDARLLTRIKIVLHYLSDLCSVIQEAREIRNILFEECTFPEIQSYITRVYIKDYREFISQVVNSEGNMYIWQFFFRDTSEKSEGSLFRQSILELYESESTKQDAIATLNLLKSFHFAFNNHELEILDRHSVDKLLNTSSVIAKATHSPSLDSLRKEEIIQMGNRIRSFLKDSKKVEVTPLLQEIKLVEEWKHLVKKSMDNTDCLFEETANALLEPSSKHHTLQGYIQDIVLLFEFDYAILLHTLIFKNIFLKILQHCMEHSRQWIEDKGKEKDVSSDDIQNLVLLQESTIVQLLLELCICSPLLQQDCGLIESIRVNICTFLHSMFICKPDLMKVVHDQGYNPLILPIACEGIPSIHYCLEFIPDILNAQNYEKYGFGVKLTSYLSKFYPIQKSLDLCYTILSTYHQSKNIPYDLWIDTIGDLARMVEAFPILIENFLAVYTKFEFGGSMDRSELILLDREKLTIKDILCRLLSKVFNFSYTSSYV